MSKIIGFLLLALASTLPLQAADVRAVLEPVEQTLITSELNSTVKSISKKMGESFEKGDELLLLDDVVFAANLLKTNAQVSKAETDFEAASQLYKDRVISHSDFRTAEASVAVARADLALAQKAFDACNIKAPYSGKVVDVFVKEYERVQPGQNLIAILNDHSLIARVLVPEQFFDRIKVGETVKVKVMETGQEVPAKIVRVAAVIDPISSLMKVEAEIDNADGTMRPGMEGVLILGNPKSRP